MFVGDPSQCHWPRDPELPAQSLLSDGIVNQNNAENRDRASAHGFMMQNMREHSTHEHPLPFQHKWKPERGKTPER